MSEGQTAALLLSLLFLILPLSSLIARRPPAGQTIRFTMAWAGIFGIGIVLFSFKDDLAKGWGAFASRANSSSATNVGKSVILKQDENGHFSVNATINGRSVPMMIDSGATTTTLSRRNADAANVAVSPSGFAVVVETANGMVAMRRARIDALAVGQITLSDHPILVSEAGEGIDVLGMNFLNALGGWQVKGKEMILTPPAA